MFSWQFHKFDKTKSEDDSYFQYCKMFLEWYAEIMIL